MRCLGRIIAFWILIILIVVIPTTIWLEAMWDIATAPDTYTDTLDDEVYQSLAPLLIPALADGMLEREYVPEVRLVQAIIQNIDDNEWEAISADIIEPAWLQEEMGRNMSGLMTYLHGESDSVSIQINSESLHARLTEDSGEIAGALTTAMADWDTCTLRDGEAYEAFIAEERTTLPICRPTSSAMERFEAAVMAGLERMAEELPEDEPLDLKARLIEEGQVTATEYDNELRDIRRFVIFIDHAGPVFLLFPVMLLGLIMIFAVRTAREFFLWAGLPLVLGGLLTLLPLVSWLYTLTEPFQDTSDNSLVVLGAAAFFDVTRVLARDLTTPVLFVAFLMVTTGFVFLVLSSVLPDRQEAVQQYFYVPTTGSGTPTPTPVPTHTPPQQPVIRESTGQPVSGPISPPPTPTETARNPGIPTGETGTYMDDMTFIPGPDDADDIDESL